MRIRFVFLEMCFLSAPASLALAADDPRWPPDLPVYDHTVVVEENKNYKEAIGRSDVATCLNKLAHEGASLANMCGKERRADKLTPQQED